MKGIEEIRRRADEIAARVHAGMIQSTDEAGNETWIEGREAISIMRELLRVAQDKDCDELTLSDIPEGLKHKVWLLANVQLEENGGELTRFVKEQCQEIIKR